MCMKEKVINMIYWAVFSLIVPSSMILLLTSLKGLPVWFIVIMALFMELVITIVFWDEIQRFVISSKGIELEKYKRQVDNAMVQYKEFQETITPMLEITLGNLAASGYFNASPKSEVIVDFIDRAKKIKPSAESVDKIDRLLGEANLAALNAFKTEFENIKPGTGQYIDPGRSRDFSMLDYTKTNPKVDIVALNEIAKDMEPGKERQYYKKKLDCLNQFWQENF